MKKIYIIEGLPGSGKTTFSKKLSTYLKNQKIPNQIFNEGDLHPVDLAWTAILDQKEYDDLINKYHNLEKQIMNHMKRVDDHYYIAYTKIKVEQHQKDFYEHIKQYEIYKTDDSDVFLCAHLDLWKKFIEAYKSDDQIYIFECIFLQNHINELMLKHNMSDDEIIDYFKRFTEVFKHVEVELIYINQLDINAILKRITEERRTTDKTMYKDWIDLVIEYLENSRYGIKKGYKGYQGVINYFFDRKHLELSILNELDLTSHVIKLKEDYQETFSEIIKHIKL